MQQGGARPQAEILILRRVEVEVVAGFQRAVVHRAQVEAILQGFRRIVVVAADHPVAALVALRDRAVVVDGDTHLHVGAGKPCVLHHLVQHVIQRVYQHGIGDIGVVGVGGGLIPEDIADFINGFHGVVEFQVGAAGKIRPFRQADFSNQAGATRGAVQHGNRSACLLHKIAGEGERAGHDVRAVDDINPSIRVLVRGFLAVGGDAERIGRAGWCASGELQLPVRLPAVGDVAARILWLARAVEQRRIFIHHHIDDVKAAFGEVYRGFPPLQGAVQTSFLPADDFRAAVVDQPQFDFAGIAGVTAAQGFLRAVACDLIHHRPVSIERAVDPHRRRARPYRPAPKHRVAHFRCRVAVAGTVGDGGCRRVKIGADIGRQGKIIDRVGSGGDGRHFRQCEIAPEFRDVDDAARRAAEIIRRPPAHIDVGRVRRDGAGIGEGSLADEHGLAVLIALVKADERADALREQPDEARADQVFFRAGGNIDDIRHARRGGAVAHARFPVAVIAEVVNALVRIRVAVAAAAQNPVLVAAALVLLELLIPHAHLAPARIGIVPGIRFDVGVAFVRARGAIQHHGPLRPLRGGFQGLRGEAGGFVGKITGVVQHHFTPLIQALPESVEPSRRMIDIFCVDSHGNTSGTPAGMGKSSVSARGASPSAMCAGIVV
ncbi:hypothetical protein VF14_18500 [Nostoc linckia z18]|uniref:Uncharacterized protein n=1 Tax=Nostoc linckia z7 TaxID=1628745 RepID=A0ABX4KEY9_NOSLI|nr:hypothetical protein VF04_36595 [Nostoc linckia z7]PHK09351.1 hypothetical protein VF09_16175 [Nostoc linckia z9]PHK33104.1 hypothetical protein VF14_18500 [Nostoc linckia z18]